MTQATKKTTQDIADLWLGMAKKLVHHAQSLQDQIDGFANHLKADDKPLTAAHQNKLRRAICATSQIEKLLREEIKAASEFVLRQS